MEKNMDELAYKSSNKKKTQLSWKSIHDTEAKLQKNVRSMVYVIFVILE